MTNSLHRPSRWPPPARVIAFEGIDGAGKTAVLALVAEHLRNRGVPVCLPRVGKDHVSKPIREIRKLTRDRTNLDLCARTELLLYAAREAQVLEQVVRPAIAQGATVLLDRSMLTPVVLGAHGRGLDLRSCEAIALEASGGQEADLTLIFDVEPRTSRIRKRIEKIRTGETRNAGRKGLAGSGLHERLREGYLRVAARDGMPVFHCERATPREIAERVIAKLETGEFHESAEDEVPWWRVDPAASFEQAVESLPPLVRLYFTRSLPLGRALRAELFEREPELSIWAADLDDPLLISAQARAGELVLARLGASPAAVPLRERLLTSHPAVVARSLVRVAGVDADRMRERLAELAPGAVVESLSGRSDPFAHALRKRLWKHADVYERAASLQLCDDAWAWRKRERLLDADPGVWVPSLRGLSPERVDPILARHADRAPKAVLLALVGRSDEGAHDLRARLIDTGREVIDSIRGLDDPRSWALRERFCQRWPSTVVNSLIGMRRDARVDALLARCRAAAPTDLFTKRRSILFDHSHDQLRGLHDDD
jgi:dTMP kinase